MVRGVLKIHNYINAREGEDEVFAQKSMIFVNHVVILIVNCGDVTHIAAAV